VRAILFCNEMLGLGHLRLSLAIASALVEREAEDGASALVVTGSPAFGAIAPINGVDILKLPTLPVSAESSWAETALRPKAGLRLATSDITGLRAELCLTAVRAFEPDMIVVDYKPLGRDGELRDALQWCRSHLDCLIALGLWDVDDAPERLRATWTDELVDAVQGLYDLALVYGPEAPGDVRLERLRAGGIPIRHTGLVASPPAERGPSDLEPGYLLACAGGGVDGFELLAAVLGAVKARPPGLPAVVVTGPMMSREKIGRLRASALGLDVRVEEFRPDMDALLAGARAVVAMAGYCTVAEIIASGTPALLVPRVYPREEQLNRARRWAAEGWVALLDPRELDAATLGEAIAALLARPARMPTELSGAVDAASILTDILGARAQRPRSLNA
jgi:predicted glycosyltransferase